MYHGRYIGADKELRGKRAIIRIETHLVQDMTPRNGEILCETVLAQFDDKTTAFCYGWHPFKAEDFEIEYKYGKVHNE